MVINPRYKVGKCVERPMPTCIFCGSFLKARSSVIERDRVYLDCHNCDATFEVDK